MNTSFFGELLQTISDRGRALRGRDRRGDTSGRSEGLIDLCEHLLSGRGEASGVALAREILTRYAGLKVEQRMVFFETLAKRFGTDPARMEKPLPPGVTIRPTRPRRTCMKHPSRVGRSFSAASI